MKLTVVGAVFGLLVSIAWLVWGFWSMIGIVFATLLFATIGLIIDTTGISIKEIANRVTARFSQ